MLNNKILEILAQEGIIITEHNIDDNVYYNIIKCYKKEFPFYILEIYYNTTYDNIRMQLYTYYRAVFVGINYEFNYGLNEAFLPTVLHDIYRDLERKIQEYER